MIATSLPILRIGPSRVVSTSNGDQCSIDTTLGMTNLGTAAIRRSAADRAVVAIVRADETTRAECSHATSTCLAGPSARSYASGSGPTS
jgi:hypothetical protein